MKKNWTPVFVSGHHVRNRDGRHLYTDGKEYKYIADTKYRLRDDVDSDVRPPRFQRGQRFIVNGRVVKIILVVRDWAGYAHYYRVLGLGRVIDWLSEDTLTQVEAVR